MLLKFTIHHPVFSRFLVYSSLRDAVKGLCFRAFSITFLMLFLTHSAFSMEHTVSKEIISANEGSFIAALATLPPELQKIIHHFLLLLIPLPEPCLLLQSIQEEFYSLYSKKNTRFSIFKPTREGAQKLHTSFTKKRPRILSKRKPYYQKSLQESLEMLQFIRDTDNNSNLIAHEKEALLIVPMSQVDTSCAAPYNALFNSPIITDIATYQRLFQQELLHELQNNGTDALYDTPHIALFKQTLLNLDNTLNEKAFWNMINSSCPAINRDLQKELWTLKGYFCYTLQGHTESISALAISPDGLLVATGSNDTTVRIWTTEGELLYILEGHIKGISSLAFSPDSTMILSGSWDTTACLWNTHTGGKLAVLHHNNGVWSTLFDTSGIRILTKTSDQEVHIWELFCDNHKLILQEDIFLLIRWLCTVHLISNYLFEREQGFEKEQDSFAPIFLQSLPKKVQGYLVTYLMQPKALASSKL